MELRFEWDQDKAHANVEKHGVRFEEACTVFRDPLELMTPDLPHSIDEERWFSIARSEEQRLLVGFYIQHGATIRIISARLPTSRERRKYEEAEDE